MRREKQFLRSEHCTFYVGAPYCACSIHRHQVLGPEAWRTSPVPDVEKADRVAEKAGEGESGAQNLAAPLAMVPINFYHAFLPCNALCF